VQRLHLRKAPSELTVGLLQVGSVDLELIGGSPHLLDLGLEIANARGILLKTDAVFAKRSTGAG
jgi:hypothetical protein